MFGRITDWIRANQLLTDTYRKSRLLYVVQAAVEYFVSILVTGAYLARLTRELDFSDATTGLISSFLSLSGSFQLAALFMFRKRGSVKKPLIMLIQFSQLLFTFMYITPLVPIELPRKQLLFLIFYGVAYLLQSVSTPQKTAWLMSLVDDSQRGRFTAKKEIVSLLSGMLFTYVAGAVVDNLEAQGDTKGALIAGALTLSGLMVINTLLLLSIREKPREMGKQGKISWAFLKNPVLWKLVVLTSLWYIASHVSVPFYGAYQINTLGFSMRFVSVLSILYSIVRSLVSPVIGRYADKNSFIKSLYLCLWIAGLAFLVNCFTVPENGSVLYTLYYCLYAVSMAGINSGMVNIVFDLLPGPERSYALAITAAVSGFFGFLSTCAMTPLMEQIQQNGNTVLGIPMYPAQIASAVAVVCTLAVLLYLRVFMFRHINKDQ